MAIWCLMLFGISQLIFVSNSIAGPVIKTSYGKIQGIEAETYSHVKHYQFLGVPFAKPPLGDLRFKNPQPLEPWEGILNATKEKDACLQLVWGGTTSSGSLDCLGINIAIPKLPNPKGKDLLPVMVWIHGGAFTEGSGAFAFMYKPDNFINKGVIICNIQYRLGIYGYLSFEDPEVGVPGNVGFKDQVHALRWIKENIIYFGGDPNEITIFGESAGGTSVEFLSVSPLAKGLFSKLISQSGSGDMVLANIRRKYKEVGNLINCTSSVQKEIFDCISGKSDSELLDAVGRWSMIDRDQLGLQVSFGPVIETYPTKESFMLESYEQTLVSKNYEPIPKISGYNTNEGGLGLALSYLPLNFGEEFYEDLIPTDVKVVKGTKESKELGKKIKEFYYGLNDPSEDYLFNYIDFQTDYQFLIKIYRNIRLLRKYSDVPLYFYKFNFVDPFKLWNKRHPKHPIISHDYELAIEFHIRDQIKTNNTDYLKAEEMIIDLWTSFAKNGVPASHTLGFSWLTVESSNFCNLVMQPNQYLANFIEEKERMDFWDQVYLQYNNDSLVL